MIQRGRCSAPPVRQPLDALRALTVRRRSNDRVAAALGNDAVESCLLRGAMLGIPVCAISTCERFELYALGDPGELVGPLNACSTAAHAGEPAVRHLFRVAAGLDSRLVGEPHILGQVRRAADLAETVGVLGPVLRGLFDRALRCGRRARAGTGLDRIARGYAELAAARMDDELASGRGHAVILGTGSTAREVVTATRTATRGRLIVLGRHAERTRRFGADLGVRTGSLDDLTGHAAGAGVILAATLSPRVLVDAEHIARGARPVLIDLGVPRNIAAGLPGRIGLEDIAAAAGPATSIVAEAERVVHRHAEAALAHGRWRTVRPATVRMR